MKVNAKKDVLQNARNDQDDVEQGLEAVEVLSDIQKAKSRKPGRVNQTFCKADFFLGGVSAFGPSR